jgi:hypothetical protein
MIFKSFHNCSEFMRHWNAAWHAGQGTDLFVKIINERVWPHVKECETCAVFCMSMRLAGRFTTRDNSPWWYKYIKEKYPQ